MRKPVLLAMCFAMALGFTARAEDKKADPVGTWKWSSPGQNGQVRETTLKMKYEGDKLTGMATGRNNAENPITEVKLKGDELSFQIVREFNGNKITQKYNGKIDGDVIKGKVETARGDAEPTSRDWEAKREVKPKDDATKPKEETKPAPK